ncbi:shikimate dehydrogenase [Fusobacterium sp.]|uniref:shikimate dehydrogenase n=1 Tax=Fusobacterium sp. TaxID=68766 RepID=UPI0028FF5D1A|nr:shikimate dehydrogenase [Fusobacterium sp.]MDU1910686.1 shikimate dehydrogenase [Fusobacterium sp.]
MKTYGLIGEKLGHSLSPVIHQYIFERYKIKGYYSLYEIEKKNAENIIEGMKIMGIEGVNITIPYKETLLSKIDFLSEEGEKIGAINVLKIKSGKSYGYNSDYYGFIRLLERGEIEVKNKRCVILGTGGAAKSVITALHDLGAESITVVSRTLSSKLTDLLRIFPYINLAVYENFLEGDVIINTTPVGMYPNVEISPVDEEVIKRFRTAVDIIYNPLKTEFLKLAEKNKLQCADGLHMLIEQAIKAQEIWQETKFDDSLGEELYSYLADNFIG